MVVDSEGWTPLEGLLYSRFFGVVESERARKEGRGRGGRKARGKVGAVEGGAGLDFSGEGGKEQGVPEGGEVPPVAGRGGEEECGDGVEGESGAVDASADADADTDVGGGGAAAETPHPLLAPLTQPFIEAMVGLLLGSQPRDLRRQAQSLCEACVAAALRGEVVGAMRMLESGRSARNG